MKRKFNNLLGRENNLMEELLFLEEEKIFINSFLEAYEFTDKSISEKEFCLGMVDEYKKSEDSMIVDAMIELEEKLIKMENESFLKSNLQSLIE